MPDNVDNNTGETLPTYSFLFVFYIRSSLPTKCLPERTWVHVLHNLRVTLRAIPAW
jgi:hypothetical protein